MAAENGVRGRSGRERIVAAIDQQRESEDFAGWRITRADNKIEFRSARFSDVVTVTFVSEYRVLSVATGLVSPRKALDHPELVPGTDAA